MAAYIIADVNVTDPEKMARYREYSSRAGAQFNAKFIVRGGDFEILEGPWKPGRLVVIEFPDRQSARDFYYSDAYTHARSLREGAGIVSMVLVEGLS